MSTIIGFPPIADGNATVLILGSMPSEKSLQEQQYYAHPHNSFWFIMTQLFHGETGMDYERRKALLITNRIALWDVLDSCQREGSLDSSIKDDSVVVNDFADFFETHPLVRAVYFNGARAQQEFNKRVLPVLGEKFAKISYRRLPSTSPAMASLTREQKLEEWKCILEQPG